MRCNVRVAAGGVRKLTLPERECNLTDAPVHAQSLTRLLFHRGAHARPRLPSAASQPASDPRRANPIPPQALLEAARAKAKGQPPDMKSAMQAACAVGNQTVLRVLMEEGAFKVRGPCWPAPGWPEGWRAPPPARS